MFIKSFLVSTVKSFKFFLLILKFGLLKKRRPKLATEMLVSLGPVFIKVGQVLSTRNDKIPQEYIQELEKLRDNVPRDKNQKTLDIIRNKFPKGINTVFKSFNYEPVAAGAFANTYSAVLVTGEHVAVKVLKGDVNDSLETNIKILISIAKILEKFSSNLRSINLTGLVSEITELLQSHTDLENEIKNYRTFAEISKNNEHVTVPEVFEEISDSQVLVTEFVDAIAPYEFEKLGIEPRILAQRVDDMLDEMLYFNGFLHADLHPGNFFWNKKGQLVLIDFGMAHSFTQMERNHIMTFYFAIVEGYYDFATEYCLKNFVSNIGSSDGKITDELFNISKKSLYKAFIEADKLDFSAMLSKLISLISKYKLLIKPNYNKAFLSLTAVDGYIYHVDPTFDMIENVRNKRLRMAEYATLPDEAVKIVFGDYATYSNAIFENGSDPKEAYEKRDQFIFDKIDLKKGQFVIDVGCGRGQLLKKITDKESRALGITISRPEYEVCLEKGLECEWTSWEEFNNTKDREYPKADSMTVVEVLLHMGNFHENKAGLVDKRLDTFFSWAHDQLVDDGKLFIQSLNIVDEFLYDKQYEDYCNRVSNFLPWLGFTTFQQIVSSSSKYFEIKEVFNHSEDLIPTSSFFKSTVEKNESLLIDIIKPDMYQYMKDELDIGIDLAQDGLLKLYRTVLVKKPRITE